MKKWRSFRLGKYKLSIYQRRCIHTGIGYRTGCGHNITEICHALTYDGVEIWRKHIKYLVEIKVWPTKKY